MTPSDHLKRAIEIAGGQCALARLVGKSQHAIWHTLNKQKRCSVEMAILIEKALDGAVTRQQLRPDLFSDDNPLVGGGRGAAFPSYVAPRILHRA